jgi:hypothetical protein
MPVDLLAIRHCWLDYGLASYHPPKFALYPSDYSWGCAWHRRIGWGSRSWIYSWIRCGPYWGVSFVLLQDEKRWYQHSYQDLLHRVNHAPECPPVLEAVEARRFLLLFLRLHSRCQHGSSITFFQGLRYGFLNIRGNLGLHKSWRGSSWWRRWRAAAALIISASARTRHGDSALTVRATMEVILPIIRLVSFATTPSSLGPILLFQCQAWCQSESFIHFRRFLLSRFLIRVNILRLPPSS